MKHWNGPIGTKILIQMRNILRCRNDLFDCQTKNKYINVFSVFESERRANDFAQMNNLLIFILK